MTAAEFVDDLQNIVTEYMKKSGYSVGISDLIADKQTNEMIVEKISNKKNDVANIIDQKHLGAFDQ
jgi:DNA-directed RNA polymerase II subunit RPB1